jgi:hypothetical protein
MVDPLAPLTPAQQPQPKAKGRPQHPQPTLKTPVPTTFASRQIQGSRNKLAATVLFTPRTKQCPVPTYQQSPSPTPYQPPSMSTLHPRPSSDSGSDFEGEVRAGLKRLELQPRPGSGSQSPRAGPHSRQRMPTKALKSKGGAKDVWIFFEKVSGRHACVFCK